MALHCDKQYLSRLLPRYLSFRTIAIYWQPCHFIVTMSIAVASPTYFVEDDSHLWTTMSLHCYSKGVLCPLPNTYGSLTKSIVTQHCQTIAVNKVHWYAFFRGYCSGNVLFSFYCQGFKHVTHNISLDENRPLPKVSKCTAADNVHRQPALLAYCGWQWPLTSSFSWLAMAIENHLFGVMMAAMIYRQYSSIRTGCTRLSLTTRYHSPYNPHWTQSIAVMLTALLLRRPTWKFSLISDKKRRTGSASARLNGEAAWTGNALTNSSPRSSPGQSGTGCSPEQFLSRPQLPQPCGTHDRYTGKQKKKQKDATIEALLVFIRGMWCVVGGVSSPPNVPNTWKQII